jgi:hypothetical protein
MFGLKVPPETAIRLIQERIDALAAVRRTQGGLEYYDIIGWCSKTWSVIDSICAAGDYHPEEIRSIALSNCSCGSDVKALILAEEYHARLLAYIREIQETMQNIPV